jgi:hypothetical protein
VHSPNPFVPLTRFASGGAKGHCRIDFRLLNMRGDFVFHVFSGQRNPLELWRLGWTAVPPLLAGAGGVHAAVLVASSKPLPVRPSEALGWRDERESRCR